MIESNDKYLKLATFERENELSLIIILQVKFVQKTMQRLKGK